MITREQHSTIDEIVTDHGTAELNQRRSIEGVEVDVRCEDGFGCWVDEDGGMHERKGTTATRKGKGWS